MSLYFIVIYFSIAFIYYIFLLFLLSTLSMLLLVTILVYFAVTWNRKICFVKSYRSYIFLDMNILLYIIFCILLDFMRSYRIVLKNVQMKNQVMLNFSVCLRSSWTFRTSDRLVILTSKWWKNQWFVHKSFSICNQRNFINCEVNFMARYFKPLMQNVPKWSDLL